MSKMTIFVEPLKHRNMTYNTVTMWVGKHWFKIMLVGMVAFLLQQKNVNLELNLSAQPAPKTVNDENPGSSKWSAVKNNLAAGLVSKKGNTQVSFDGNIANTYSNMTYHESKAKKYRTPEELAKIKKQMEYVDRFAKVAQSEMEKFNIPASIKLAQGLIETNAGASRLSKRNNNHFGMKCFSKKCKKGHCSNFTDDSHKDFFRIYGSAWASYRSHSKMLKNNKRYRSLFNLSPYDYKAWAHGLKKAGYATDKRYAEKLIATIEELELWKYDKQINQ